MVDMTTDTTKPWLFEKDAENNTYLKRQGVFQRFRFANEFDINEEVANKEIIESEYRGVTKIVLPQSSIVFNNPKNLNPCIIKPKRENSNVNAIILTIGGRYKLVKYETAPRVSIRYTFGDDNLNGALISYDATTEGDIISLVISKNDKLYDLSYRISKGRLKYSMYPKQYDKNFTYKKQGIKFLYHSDIPTTELYFTKSEFTQELVEMLSKTKINRKNIICIDNINDEEMEALIISLTKQGYRGVTEYKVKLPFDIIKKFKFQFVLIMDETGKLKTIKSN